MWDVAIIGAGLSGMTCAQQLTVAGSNVCLLDKSRGLGGRLATRRVYPQAGQPLRIDHGLPYWQPQSAGLRALTAELLEAGLLKVWPVRAYEIRQREWLTPAVSSAPIYVAAAGISAIAKHLGQGLTSGKNLFTDHRVITLRYQSEHWQIGCEGGETIVAKQCVMAIPAPQAAALLRTWGDHDACTGAIAETIAGAISQLSDVKYHPCLTVLAGYDHRYYDDMGELSPEGWMVSDQAGTSTQWVGLDSSKRDDKGGPVTIVIHSKPAFAQQYIDTRDLQPAASVLLRASARKLRAWIAQPDWFQIHRWRYAQVNIAHCDAALKIGNALICGGDWCRPQHLDGPMPDTPIPDTPTSEASTSEAPTPEAPTPEAPTLQSIDYAYLSGLAMAEMVVAKAMQSE